MMNRRSLLMTAGAIIALLFCGCDDRGNVLLTGTLIAYAPGDTVSVSLTDNWQYVRVAPKRFMINESGYFELEFTVGRNPPPVTVIKNDKVYAKLVLRNLWEHSTVIVDELRTKVFPVRYEQNGLFRAELLL